MPLKDNLSNTEKTSRPYSATIIAKYKHAKISFEKLLLCTKASCDKLKGISPESRVSGKSREYDLSMLKQPLRMKLIYYLFAHLFIGWRNLKPDFH